MDDIPQGIPCGLADILIGLSCSLAYFVQVTVGSCVSCSQPIELAQDTFLHLGSGLVGESHSQNMAVGMRIFDQLPDVLHGQRKSLAGSCRSLVDIESGKSCHDGKSEMRLNLIKS